LEFTRHCEDMIKERNIRREWVERCISSPEETEEHDDGTLHFLLRIEENGNRWLRTVMNVKVEPNKAITAFFDRRMKREP